MERHPNLRGKPLAPVRDRRSWPRLDVRDQVRATAMCSGLAVRVLDLSYGGCLIESDEPFAERGIHQFQFETCDGAVVVTMSAQVAHCRRDSEASKYSRWVTGFRFVAPRTRDAIAEFDRLIETLSAIFTFD